jgi:hypothetical protein
LHKLHKVDVFFFFSFFVAVVKPKITGSSDEKGPDSSDGGNKTRGGWSKGKKRKKAQRDQTAPRQPLTGM